MFRHASWLLLGAALLLAGLPASAVKISEFMADNKDTLEDEDGDSSDWIEIFNDGTGTVNLAGWHLTDDPLNLTNWAFPSTNLAPGGFCLVFASSKDRRVPGLPLHTNFRLNQDGEYLALVGPGPTVAMEFAPVFPTQETDVSYGMGQSVTTNLFVWDGKACKYLAPTNGAFEATWMATNFNDAAWSSGLLGLGYESNIAGFVVSNHRASVAVSDITVAELVATNAASRTATYTANDPAINYLSTGDGAYYGSDRAFPGLSIGADDDDFVVDAQATVTIPAAGSWTFCARSDDGFRLRVGSFSSEYPWQRGPGDTLATFSFPAAGDYPLRLVYYERGGGSSLELSAMPGAHGAWNSSFRLVGDTNGGLAARAPSVGGGGVSSLRAYIRTDVQPAMAGRNATLWMRTPFVVATGGPPAMLNLRTRYDDGLAAWVNGILCASRAAPTALTWNATATVARAASDAATAEEISMAASLPALKAGTNWLAVQGLNRSAGDGDFLLAPELVEYRVTALSNRFFAVPTPGALNAMGAEAIVADTKFTPNRGFFTGATSVTLSCSTPGATIRYTLDGTTPSPSNGTVYAGPIPLSSTRVIRAMAYRTGWLPTEVDTHTYLFLADVIRQSSTGAAPPGWPASWSPNTTDYGMDPDVVNHVAYSATITNDLRAVPSMCLTVRLSELFDSSTGIYANAAQDGRAWERPVSLELINPDGSTGFQVDAGVRIRGGYSRSTDNPKHAFRILFRSEYGDPKLRYPLFGDEGAEEFDAIDLRTFQNYSWSFGGDSRGIFVRDQVNRDLQVAMGSPGAHGRYYHLYINGQYWGLYNTDERPEAAYAETYFGGTESDYDVVKVEAGPYTLNATDGDMDAWTRLYHAAMAGVSSDSAYQRLLGNNADGSRNPAYEVLVDPTNLVDYMLVILYGGNLDAPTSWFLGNDKPNNWYGIRNRNGTEGFRYFVHDAEHTFLNLYEDRSGPFSAGASSVSYSSPQLIWQQLQANAEFRLFVADRMQRHFFNGGVLTPGAVSNLFLRRKNEIDRAVVGESARWGDAKRHPPLTRNSEWIAEINNVLSGYIPSRSQVVLNQLIADNLYPAVAPPSFSRFGGAVTSGYPLVITAPAGTIYYTRDGADPRRLGGSVAPAASAYGGPVPMTGSARVKARVRSGAAWSALVEADFFLAAPLTNLLVTEIMYHPRGPTGTDDENLEFLELKNLAAAPVDLGGLRITNGVGFAFPAGSRIAPGAFAVLVSRREAFTNRYPGVAVAGEYTGRLDNAGERLTMVDASGATVFSADYDDETPWPVTADGDGYSLVPANPLANPDPAVPSNWRASRDPGGSPGADDPAPGVPVVWINELLTHTDPPQEDSLELYNPGSSNADVSGWWLTDDLTRPRKYRITPGTVIPPGGYEAIDATAFGGSFLLSSYGEQVYLFSGDAESNLTGYSDGFAFPAAENGVPFGRVTTSDGRIHYPPQTALTLGAVNPGPRVGPVVFSEICYRPASGDVEFVELKNLSATNVPLYDPDQPTNTWELEGLEWRFPTGVVLAADEYLVVVAGNPASFRTRHHLPSSVPVLGPFTGILQDGGERLRLQRPDTPDVLPGGGTYVPYVVVDEARYDDDPPWPQAAALYGGSLEKVVEGGFGSEPLHWQSAAGVMTPGAGLGGNRRPTVSAGTNQVVHATGFPCPVVLRGGITDDGLPTPPGVVTAWWSKADGPGVILFVGDARSNVTAWLPGGGTYLLRLIASDGALEGSADMVVEVDRPLMSEVLVPDIAEWRYRDTGEDLGTSWRQPAFDDHDWPSGPAGLGYGWPDVVSTIVGYGPDPDRKYPTTHFRHSFVVQNAAAFQSAQMVYLRDDGAVMYLNGVEIARDNMPEGDITNGTWASSELVDGIELDLVSHAVPASLLVDGTNVLAVEIHQASPASYDLLFAAELSGTRYPDNTAPSVYAGRDATSRVDRTLSLSAAQVSDEGMPLPPGVITFAWFKAGGPGDVTFGDSNVFRTTAAFGEVGTYTLGLAVSDGALASTDTVVATVWPEDYAAWRSNYFTAAERTNSAISGDAADPDGDGHGNRQEFIAGTNPRDGASALRVDAVSGADELSGATIRVSFDAVAGRGYAVWAAESPTDAVWCVAREVPGAPTNRTVAVEVGPGGIGAARSLRLTTPRP